MTSYYLSSPRMTVEVKVDSHEIIRWSALIVHKFIGQPLSHLLRWMKPDVIELIGAD